VRDLSKYDEIIIWGASMPLSNIGVEQVSSHGHAADSLYKLLSDNGYADKISMWVDSNSSLHGKYRHGKLVCSPSELLNHENALLIINSISMVSILRAFDSMGAKNDVMIIPCYYYNGTVEHKYDNFKAREVIDKYGDEIKELFDLNDDETKRYLDIIFEQRRKCSDDLYSRDYYRGTGANMSYFCDSAIAPQGDVTLIDVGAYDGDSIERVRQFYGERLKSCIAFEPDKDSLAKLTEYVDKSNMAGMCKVYSYALGNGDRTMGFSRTGNTSEMSECGGDTVEQKKFDSLGLEKYVTGAAMVKMDIEGAEEGALSGMEKFIRKYKPYLAICIYHKESDIYRIPKLIKEIYPKYRLFIRGGWHLECWAVPDCNDFPPKSEKYREL
jgi:FkbM family methyltransferase